MLRSGPAWFSIVVSCLLSAPAWAQDRDAAAAQALFDQARELMTAGRYPEACPKLSESQRLDPGIGTQFHLANCYEQTGRIASAWAAFRDVASLARARGETDREEAARSRAAKLESRLPRLTVIVPSASQVDGLEVQRDGSAVGEAQWGVPVPVDPGPHALTFRAPGSLRTSKIIEVGEGQNVVFYVPVLAASDDGEAAPAGPSETAPSESDRASRPERESGSSSTLWVVGLGGVGVVGLGVGTAFALMARSEYTDSKRHCRPTDANVCQRFGLDQRESARAKGNVATVGFVAGGVALAGAGVVWLLSGKSSHETSHVRAVDVGGGASADAAELWLSGSF